MMNDGLSYCSCFSHIPQSFIVNHSSFIKMVDITHKTTTLRWAIAEATVVLSEAAAMQALLENTVPKGNVFEMAKTAGLFAVKKTADMIPDCHPIPVEYTAVRYETNDLEIRIEMEVKAIYRTGVEVEAMHGVSVVALTMYDMLKPIDKGIEIRNIRLLKKKGGKSDFKDKFRQDLRAAVVVCSDSVSAGKKQDSAGQAIIAKLKTCEVAVQDYLVIPDDVAAIQTQVKYFSGLGIDLLIFTGGTGLSPRDITPEAIRPLLDREIPGITEAARAYGQERMPWSMLSRGVAGTIGDMLVLTLPGSTGGATETMDALFPAILHVFRIFQAARHD
jgi:cyclic pyranopterin monophosphate synthase